MRVAALFDIHGNLPALDAVLEEVRAAGADEVVIGGDVVPGPMPIECLERLEQLDMPVHHIHGNCERAVLAQMAAKDASAVTYWGTPSGTPPPPEVQQFLRWTAQKIDSRYERVFAGLPRTLEISIEGIGRVLFCHATPRSEVEVFTKRTDEERLRPLFEGLGVTLVVCGHTHMQFDRQIGATRVVNSGSVGMPIGASGAFWTLLGPDVELRRTAYDVRSAVERLCSSEYPHSQQFVRDLLQPPDEAKTLELYESIALS